MSSRKAIMDISKICHGLKSTAVILLVAVYIGGNPGSGLFHRIFHGQESFISHSPELEKDPCHRVVYHFEKDNLCQHDSHFGVNDACDQCDILCKPDQITGWDSSKESVEPGATIRIIITFAQPEETFLYHPSRAPPLT